MTVGPEFMGLLEQVRGAMSHSHPDASFETLFGECMRVMLKAHAKRVQAETERPRSGKDAAAGGDEHKVERNGARNRYVPARVRRAVWKRDGKRCSFVSDQGRRCGATRRLELHHREPFARGGPPTIENLAVMCKSHNALLARQDYGDAHMSQFGGKRGQSTTTPA